MMTMVMMMIHMPNIPDLDHSPLPAATDFPRLEPLMLGDDIPSVNHTWDPAQDR